MVPQWLWGMIAGACFFLGLWDFNMALKSEPKSFSRAKHIVFSVIGFMIAIYCLRQK